MTGRYDKRTRRSDNFPVNLSGRSGKTNKFQTVHASSSEVRKNSITMLLC